MLPIAILGLALVAKAEEFDEGMLEYNQSTFSMPEFSHNSLRILLFF